MKYSKKDQNLAIRNLSGLKPGQEILCHVEHVSKSGMARIIKFWTIDKEDCTLSHLSWSIACVLGEPFRKDGVYVTGGGMDMGFATVYDLSARLTTAGVLPKPEKDGECGYTLRHRWI